MTEFYREAILAARRVEPPSGNGEEIPDLDSWQQVAEALDTLSPRQRCHAIYADWLLQLHAPGGHSQIQIRDRLLGEGGLAATYLAELAQNADDSDATSLLVALEGEWLLVANNGRPLSSLNLLGLCRFFIHSDGEIVGLTEKTIGKFGIGFKSCHRVAEEVFVWSWGDHEKFGFRLPICHGGGEFSHPDQETLNALQRCLEFVGKPIPNAGSHEKLGHCTPEALTAIPNTFPVALLQRIQDFKTANEARGVWFALHLHEHGRAEAESRITSQTDALYELCPLFLNNLQTVTLQGRTMRMKVGKPLGKNVGSTGAKRITLEITEADGTTRNDRLLLLGEGSDAIWKLALPADSESKIKRPVADQFSLRSGGGYAFFPLPSLDWPWRVHIHLNCPTNLERSDWNPAERGKTEGHLQHAASALARWLTQNSELWHPSWQPADLLTKVPSELKHESSARVFAEAYKQSLNGEPSLRTLWGTLTGPDRASGLLLEPGQAVIDAWSKMAEFVPASVQEQFPLVLLGNGAVHLDLPRLKTEKAREVFDLLRTGNHDAGFWRAYALAVLGTVAESSGGYSRSELIEDLIGLVPLERYADGAITIEQASQSRFAVRLTVDWHEFFRNLSDNWLSPNWTLAGLPVLGMRISQMLRALASPAETPTGWDEVMRMTEENFRLLGDAFWTQVRPPCPPSLVEDVIRAVWVESGPDWFPLAETWIGSEPIAMLKGIVHAFVFRVGESNNQRRERMTRGLAQWAIQDAYEQIILDRVEEHALPEFQRRLTDENSANPARLRMLILGINWKPERLPITWREPVMDAAKAAIIDLFENAGFGDQRGKTILVGGGGMVKVLAWLPDYIEAPAWVEQDAIRWIVGQGIFGDLDISCEVLNGINQDQKAAFGKELLAGFRNWHKQLLTDGDQAAMRELFQGATNNWIVGHPGGANKMLREHCAWIRPQNPMDATTPLDCVIAGAEPPELNGGSFLPDALAALPELREKCFLVSQLTPELPCPDEDEANDLVEAEIPEALTKNPWFQRLRQLLPNASIVSLAGQQKLKWKRGDLELVIPMASFGLCRFQETDAIFISKSENRPPPPDYREVLYAYKSVAPEDEAFANALVGCRNFAKLYRENRARIKARLVQFHATEMGYEAKHVLRELLQNAESAYGSRHNALLPARKSFEISATPADHGSAWNIKIVHAGRAFNESDNMEKARSDDIARLCALGALQNYGKEEVGKFNRGFKSVFQVTEEVHVLSGGYDFRIKDLLLLHPAKPVRDPESTDQSTRFSFQVAADKKLELLHEKRGLAHPFTAVELVFLRQIDLVVVKISGQPEQSLEIERGNLNGGWQTVTIRASIGSKIESSFFLVCQERNAKDQRVAVAISLDEGGRPRSMSQAQRYLYRTFPLQQASDWFPFLINADFFTEKGRAGLLPEPENDALIVRALEMSLALLRSRIESCDGNIKQWLAWVNALERRKLDEGASILSAHRNEFESVLRHFDNWLGNHLPDGERLLPANEFTFPSSLMRRLREQAGWTTSLEIDDNDWIDADVAKALQPFETAAGHSYQLHEQAGELIRRGRNREELRELVGLLQRQDFAQDAVSQVEIRITLGLLTPERPEPTPFILGDEEEYVGPKLAIKQIADAWNEDAAKEQFTLAGALGRLVFVTAMNEVEMARTLDDADSIAGRIVWYRLFCLGCSMSLPLGRRPAERIVQLWDNRLNAEFWKATLPSTLEEAKSSGFDQRLDAFFEDIIHRSFRDENASGEDADFWRRVFYDFRKMHFFVFRNDLPSKLMSLIKMPGVNGDSLIGFLKSGRVPPVMQETGYERWAGVIGQSMSAPLLFVMRELRRIGVLPTDRYDTACFFMNSPARRVAAQLGWIDESERRSYAFANLVALSERMHDKTAKEAPELAQFFDLSFQWYAYKNPS